MRNQGEETKIGTKIEWTHPPGYKGETWNPISGCTKVSPGCAHCYAEAITLRFKRGGPFLPGKTTIQLHEDRLTIPLRWRNPRCIFTCSMSDLFHEEVPVWFIYRCFLNMAVTPEHIYQVLTKRPTRMAEVLSGSAFPKVIEDLGIPWPLPNVWLGTSVENQYWADRRIPLLLQTPAAVRFLSIEPLLKPVDLNRVDYGWQLKLMLADFKEWRECVPFGLRADECVPPGFAWLNVLNGEWFDGWDGGSDGNKVDWVIVGGESGPKRRPMEEAWVRLLRDQCVAAGIPFFLKQWGGPRPGGEALLDGRPWREWPEPILAGRYGSEDRL